MLNKLQINRTNSAAEPGLIYFNFLKFEWLEGEW